MFISNPDKCVQLTISGQSVKAAWTFSFCGDDSKSHREKINHKLQDLEIFGLGLGAAAYRGVGVGFRARTASESIRGADRKNPQLPYHAGQRALARPGA
jgi:hypothetical protein